MKIPNLSVCENGEEGEDYIEMEVSSSPPILHCSSSPQSREFEFQMCAASGHPPTAASPADHLFHKGRLLPLYIFHPTASASASAAAEDSFYSLPFAAAAVDATARGSCSVSPSESRRVSCDLNSDDFFFEWSSDLKTFLHHHPAKTPWPKRLNLIRSSIISQKLRASRNYLKSLFVKSTCSLDSSAKPRNPSHGGGGEISHKLPKNPNSKRKAPERLETAPYPTIAAIINNIERDSASAEDSNTVQRRSFSSAIKRHSPTKCLSSSSSNSSSGSSSFSLNSNGGVHEIRCLRRSSSATEAEGSIEAAIAHCKKSQQIF